MKFLFFSLKAFVVFLFCFSFYLTAEENQPIIYQEKELLNVHDYLRFIQTFQENLGPIGDYTKGEIQIILDPKEIFEVEEVHRLKLLRRGAEEKSAYKWSRVGIIDSDSIWIWIRDAVILPNGRKTIRDRLAWKTALDGPQDVSILPLLKDKRMVVCLKYKHARRSWQIELPRGARLYGETAETACNRQLRNETGFTAKSHLLLGSLVPDSSNFGTLTPVFLGYIDETTAPAPQSEGSTLGFLFFTREELKEAFIKGYVELKIHGERKKVAVNDSYLSYAFLQAQIRGLI